jgi:beta-N-acetylhexosaminidase
MRLSRDPAARRRLALLAATALVAGAGGVVTGAGAGDEPGGASDTAPSELGRRDAARLTLRQQVGQLLISSFDGTRLPAYLRRRLRAGETAGVILFRKNIASRGQLRALAGAVQEASDGGALVSTDQEGGQVRNVSFAGPVAGQPAQGSARRVGALAVDAARALRRAGVNVTLAPVADVTEPGSALRSRGFRSPVSPKVRASVRGWWRGRVASTAKHFPGLGAAAANTDDASVTVRRSRRAIFRRDLAPFRAAVEEDVPLIMVGHALYPALDGRRIASQSRPVVTRLLRRRMGYRGVVVTDSIEAQAVQDRSGVATAAQRSIAAGVDVVLMTGSASWNLAHPRLLARARASRSFRSRVRESAARVLDLKRKLGLRTRPPQL